MEIVAALALSVGTKAAMEELEPNNNAVKGVQRLTVKSIASLAASCTTSLLLDRTITNTRTCGGHIHIKGLH